MDSELYELHTAESQFRNTQNVQEFVRDVAKSETYKSRFFDRVSMYRCTELMYKHLLGRGIRSKEEYAQVMGVYHAKGYEGLVDWIVDSEEYEEEFGMAIVPYGRYKGCYQRNEEFNRSVAMRGSMSSSDKGRSSVLQYAVCAEATPSWLTISKGLPAGTERGTGYCIGGRWASPQRNPRAPVRRGTKVPGGVVFY